MTFRIAWCLLALAPLLANAAPQIDASATFHAAGVSVDIDAADDPNRNAVALLELRTDGDGDSINGVVRSKL